MASGNQEMQDNSNISKMFIVIILLYVINYIVEKLSLQ